ncbi:MAG TPA: response regulator [Chthoniobacteraceae bacterium]|nr:response regulator [Chthoniobacteraceae bacterium]
MSGAANEERGGEELPLRLVPVGSEECLAYWQLFFESCPAPILLLRRPDRVIASVNDAAVRLYGYSREEWRGRRFDDLGDQPRSKPFREGRMMEIRHRRRDGSLVEAELMPWSLEVKDTGYWLVYLTDVTEKKELENRLLQVQRLECIGALSSGVAHDLNNILAPIMMSAAMLHEELSPESRGEFLSTIEQSAQRGVNLLRAVLSFSRGVQGDRAPVAPAVVIREIAEMIRQTFPKMITIVSEVADDLWKILVEATKFHQILLNLVINARDAMAHGGKLTIRAENRVLDGHAAAAFPEGKPGRYVVISVEDTGVGIPKAMKRDIFTPFFTTKAPGQGTGLGLPTVLGIIKGYGGFFDLKSEVGAGTTFTVYMPAVGESSEERKPTAQGGAEGGIILVVDDEPGIRRMVTAILTRHGYKVVTACDGMEAMAAYIGNPSSFKLVLADLVMPSMDGVVLARAIKQVDAATEIIATSGFESEARLQELAALGVTRFLRKPYQASELLAMVAEVIGASPSQPGDATEPGRK